MHVGLLDPRYLSPFGKIKETKGVSMKSRLRRWRWKHGAKVSHHLLMQTLLATLNALNPLLEMIKCSLLLIHAILHTLKSLLQILKLRSEASMILIHAILHGLESSITDYYKLLHASAK